MTCPLPNSPSPTSGDTVADPPRPAWASLRSPGPAFPQSLRAPEAFTWPKVHAHWARSGPRACSVFPSQPQGLPRKVGENGRPASPCQRAPRREYGPQGLTRPGPPCPGSYSGHRGLHDTAPSCPGSDPGPARARPRGRAGAQPGPRPSLAPCLSFPLSPSRPRLSAAARPGLPSTAGPTVRAPAAGERARAYTYSAPEAMARASPGRRCGGLRVTATRMAGDRLGPGWTHSGGGATAVTNPPAASLSLPPSGTGAAGGRETLDPDPRGGSD